MWLSSLEKSWREIGGNLTLKKDSYQRTEEKEEKELEMDS